MSGLCCFKTGEVRISRRLAAYISNGTFFQRCQTGGYVLPCAFYRGIICTEKERHQYDFGTILRERLWDDMWEKDFRVFWCQTMT